MTDLQRILTEIANQQFQQNDLEKAFDEIAVDLLRQTMIVTKKDHFHLREIEIYFYDRENHPDPYAHKNKRQSEFGEWYFHKFTNINSFLNSNRNGIDITFGNKAVNLFGGLLIRKIENIKTKELIVGINKVARELIKNIGEQNINEIALGLGQKVFDDKQLMHLAADDNNSSSPIYKNAAEWLNI